MLANESSVFSDDEVDEKEIDKNLSCRSADRNRTRSLDSKKKEKELKTAIATHKLDNY